MAGSTVDRARQPSVGGFDDYLPDDLADFGALFTDDEHGGAGEKAKSGADRKDGTAGLGIDEEVSVKKRVREPRVKLDESRLLSEKGIPALRQRARNLRLKGKGHEFSDAARLLSIYQLWLDDLFPKARFADALAMVEKEGHKTGMHKRRMEWINESKPKDVQDLEDLAEDETQDHPGEQLQPDPQQQQQKQQQQPPLAAQKPDEPTADDLFDEGLEDIYGATPVPPTRSQLAISSRAAHVADEVPDEDELDALMAEAMDVHGPAQDPPRPPAMTDVPDDFDDLDALMAEAEAAA